MGVADSSYKLAETCDVLADGIDTQRKAPGYTESGGEAATLDHLLSGLADAADNMRTAGIAASLESAKPSQASIDKGTKQAKAVVLKLKKANDMITMAGSLLALTAAAASGNIPGIATAVAAVVSEAGQL